jgi:lysophospholipase L1-like esterase
MTDSNAVEIRLNAPSVSVILGLVFVNGKRIQEEALRSTDRTAGAGYSWTLTFPTAGTRRITIYGLNSTSGRFGGVAVPSGYTVWKPTDLATRRIAFIGDSYTAGAGSPPSGASRAETYMWRMGLLLGGDEFINAGVGTTGFVATVGGDASSAFAGRVNEALAMQPDVVVIAGGRNDPTSGVQVAAEALLSALSSVPEVYVMPTAANGQTAVRSALQAACETQNVPYLDIDVDAIEKGGDGVHPTWQGHQDLADAAYAKVLALTSTPPDPDPDPDPDMGVQGWIDTITLASPDDTPTLSRATLSASSGPTLSGASQWLREKRVGAAEGTTVGGSTNDLDITGSSFFRYSGFPSAGGLDSDADDYVIAGLKPGGGSTGNRWTFNVEFTTNAPAVQIRLNAGASGPSYGMITVNGRRISEKQTYTSGLVTDSGYALTLTFPSSRQRTIKIHGLNHYWGRFGGVAVANGYTVTKPTKSIAKRIVFLGDSYVAGNSGGGAGGNFAYDGFMMKLGLMMGGDDIINAGISATGFVNALSGEPDSKYSGRVADILSMNPDVVVIVGGRNDGTTGSGVQTAVQSLLDSLASVPKLYVFSNASNSTQSAVRSAIAAGCASRGVTYLDVDMDSVEKLADNIHPTWAGHQAFADQAWELMDGWSPGLWFNAPDVSSSSKLVMPHYFPPYPAVVANGQPSDYYKTGWKTGSTTPSSYYETGYLNPNGESGAHAAYGGMLRDRPYTKGIPYAGTSGYGSGSWIQNYMIEEIRVAKQYGIDGFYVDILSAPPNALNWQRAVALADAASANFPGFKVVPMLDGNASYTAQDATTVAAQLNDNWLTKGCALRVGAAYVVASYRMDSRTTTWWNDLKTALLNNHGKTVTFHHVSHTSAAHSTFASAVGSQDAVGLWGPGSDPNIYANFSNGWVTAARGRGERVISPVWAQDIRPSAGLFDEARNTHALRRSWQWARDNNVEIAQLCTWSDYSEGSNINPSVMNGTALLEISAWETARHKTGQAPAIVRDHIIVSHRTQMLSATITGSQTTFMQHWERNNKSTLREHVEVLTYLTAADHIVVTVGSGGSATVYEYDAPAGEYSYTCPMQPGAVRVTTGRGMLHNSPIEIRSTSVNDSRAYCFSSYWGPNEYQYDPTPA